MGEHLPPIFEVNINHQLKKTSELRQKNDRRLSLTSPMDSSHRCTLVIGVFVRFSVGGESSGWLSLVGILKLGAVPFWVGGFFLVPARKYPRVINNN